MRMQTCAAFAAGSLTVLMLSATIPAPSPGGTAARAAQDPQGEMHQMMEKAKKFTQPGKMHEQLQRLVGKWKTSTRFSMGGQESPPELGTTEFRWLMPGRWLISDGNGALMGKPFQSCWLLGYDNFKQSFVCTTVSSMDTAMLHSEGDLTPDGKALITYGTLDEYLTGEVGKMVRYVFRFRSATEFAVEVHDLPIGETGTKVVETVYTKA